MDVNGEYPRKKQFPTNSQRHPNRPNYLVKYPQFVLYRRLFLQPFQSFHLDILHLHPTGTYRERFKDSLYANSVPFAEIADCDQNGRIEKNDADLLITYYAQAASGQNPESLINNELSKVVYADITM